MFLQYTKELAEELAKAIESVEVKAVESQVSRMIISEEKADRDGETVILAGGDFVNYKKNPVVLMDHSYSVESIIGKTVSISVEGKKLIAEWVWAETEEAMLAKQLYDGGFLKTSSIGFIALQRSETDRSIITKWELLEWSLVAVPCNPNALSLDWKALYQKWLEAGFIKEGETIEEVQPTEFEAKILSEMSEIKAMLATLADGKVKDEEMQKEAEELKEKKELIQTVNKALSLALENIKKI